MKILSERNKLLLFMGARTVGSFVEGFCYVEEQVYVHESKNLYEFCEFIDEIGGAGRNNIDLFWQAFNHPNDKAIQVEFEIAKNKVIELTKYIK